MLYDFQCVIAASHWERGQISNALQKSCFYWVEHCYFLPMNYQWLWRLGITSLPNFGMAFEALLAHGSLDIGRWFGNWLYFVLGFFPWIQSEQNIKNVKGLCFSSPHKQKKKWKKIIYTYIYEDFFTKLL